jgi:acid phosphatase
MNPTGLIVALLLGCFCSPGATLLNAQQSPNRDERGPRSVPHEDLDALLWVQSSAEYQAIARQTFRLATMNLGPALVDPAWTASVEQQRMFADRLPELAALPPAIIVDVDETVLDNSAYQALLIRTRTEFTRQSWLDFVRQEQSPAIPGARVLLDACRNARVQVLFVTNREYEVEYATRRNLVRAGLLREDDPDVVFTKYERESWTSDKRTRRQHLASRYRILMMLGDDLNDFLSLGQQPAAGARKAAVRRYADWWGTRWITLPNPNYGGWERSLCNWNDSAPRQSKLKMKHKAVRD